MQIYISHFKTKKSLWTFSFSNPPMQRPACINGAKKPSQMTAPNWADIAVTENFMCSALKDGFRNGVSCKGMYFLCRKDNYLEAFEFA